MAEGHCKGPFPLQSLGALSQLLRPCAFKVCLWLRNVGSRECAQATKQYNLLFPRANGLQVEPSWQRGPSCIRENLSRESRRCPAPQALGPPPGESGAREFVFPERILCVGPSGLYDMYMRQ
jgi:hypothetical protein